MQYCVAESRNKKTENYPNCQIIRAAFGEHCAISQETVKSGFEISTNWICYGVKVEKHIDDAGGYC